MLSRAPLEDRFLMPVGGPTVTHLLDWIHSQERTTEKRHQLYIGIIEYLEHVGKKEADELLATKSWKEIATYAANTGANVPAHYKTI